MIIEIKSMFLLEKFSFRSKGTPKTQAATCGIECNIRANMLIRKSFKIILAMKPHLKALTNSPF